ncbi:integrin alpha-V-like [Heterocephalus glaber]|uniref:Integrin alpha-V-like n=1 Tax=Heterocephalus glaber TaxID=10181 RepID=A0AAX6QKS0_HETGA|nr:integrin alpha-V-like [Heterocephalus glaber]
MARSLLLLPLSLLPPPGGAFNLDADSPAEYAAPEGSYFGFAVDFFAPSASSMFLLVGAPKANTTQPGILEGGQVLKCDWSSSRHCQPIEFDSTGLKGEKLAESKDRGRGGESHGTGPWLVSKGSSPPHTTGRDSRECSSAFCC